MDRSGEGFEDTVEELSDDGVELLPTEKDIADVAYLAWELSGEVELGYLSDSVEEHGMEVNPYQVSEAMDHLADQGIVEKVDSISYDLGESQQFIQPDTGIFDRLASTFLGAPFIEDPIEAFRQVWNAQQQYENPLEPDGTGEEEAAHLYPVEEELGAGDVYSAEDPYEGKLDEI